ncbi:PAS domain-containing sensor histidine kinase [Pseudolabrys sp. Root1462]|nr:PAS domain-containing sensor histidine kinase [Pseudolabrys sp. Root1462]
MPEGFRTANEALRSRPIRGGFFAAVILTGLTVAQDAAAADGSALDRAVASFGRQEIATFTLLAGLVCFAVLATAVLIRSRGGRRDHVSRDDAMAMQAEIDRLRQLLLSQPQVIITWPAAADEPEILGDTAIVAPGGAPQRVLAFGAWLEPAAAQRMEDAVTRLRGEGRGFVMTLTTQAGRPLEAEGRALGGRAVLRLRDVSGIESELVAVSTKHDRLAGDLETLKTMLEALPAPVWARDAAGRLIFVNSAYAHAVEADDATGAVERNLELLEGTARAEIMRLRADGQSFAKRLPAVVAGERRIFDVLDTPTVFGAAGIAIDRTEAETMRTELRRMTEAHRRLLDQLATGVAIFNADRKLTFYNTAFRALFDLDPVMLDQTPTDTSVLDTLRSARKLPEEQDFRQWKQQLYEAYRAVEPKEHMWHLPDGRTLRVVTTPNPEGGVTYLYDDVTERLAMRRNYEALNKVQSETLDNLAEAVAVFGSDGRVRLHNPAFQRLWKLTPEALNTHPHVEAVTAWSQALHDDSALWRGLRAGVTGIDNRTPLTARIERRDGMMIDMATMPLPDGATLVTFQDVTDTVNVERALRERNEALVAADSIKIEFVHHVSYELRSPLTNIIGFANLLADPVFGPLTPKQHEYLGYITTSTNALLAIINNILDLATIDAGAMTLNLTQVDIRSSMAEAAEGVQDRLIKNNLRLDIVAASDIGSFAADAKRLRQILFNLLSNAIGFSPANATVTLAAERRNGDVIFSVTDHGPGIEPARQEKVFDMFETDSKGSQHRGTGLGLSLVRSFVELHGGSVSIDSTVGRGTTFTCVFPAEQHRQPAETEPARIAAPAKRSAA